SLVRSQHVAGPGSYALSLHDALPIYRVEPMLLERGLVVKVAILDCREVPLLIATEVRRDALQVELRALVHRTRKGQCIVRHHARSEEHTSELQSRGHLVCRLLLEKKK